MATDRLSISTLPSTGGLETTQEENPLGAFLRDRRARLDPAMFGFSAARRRTPGLRREEVAQRADVSATWYTWLEQGRGGVPSSDALDRIAGALALNPLEREHLFLLAQGRPPEIHIEMADAVSPRLQRMLDALEVCPAYVKTATWDVIAWNRAAAAVLGDFGAMPPERRNALRRLFCDPNTRTRLPDWESGARALVAAFRADVARAGATAQVARLVEELTRESSEFAAIWREGDVGSFGEGSKVLNHPIAGPITLEYSAFAVDGQLGLGMVIFSPATSEDADRIRALVASL